MMDTRCTAPLNPMFSLLSRDSPVSHMPMNCNPSNWDRSKLMYLLWLFFSAPATSAILWYLVTTPVMVMLYVPAGKLCMAIPAVSMGKENEMGVRMGGSPFTGIVVLCGYALPENEQTRRKPYLDVIVNENKVMFASEFQTYWDNFERYLPLYTKRCFRDPR